MPQGGRLEKGLQALDAALGETGGTRLEAGLAALDAALGVEDAAPAAAQGFFGAEEHGRLPAIQHARGEQGPTPGDRERDLRARAVEQERLRTTPAKPSTGEKLSSAATSAWGGLVEGILSLPEFAGRVAQGSAEQIRTPRAPTARGRRDYSKPSAPVPPSEGQEAAAGWLKQSGDFLVALAQEGKKDIPPADPRVEGTFWGGTVPRGLGQIGGMAAAGVAGGAAGAFASSAAMGGTSLMAEVERDLKPKVESGELTQEEAQERAWTAFAAGMALAIPDALSLGNMLWRTDKATGGGVRKALMSVLTNSAVEGATEAVQTGGEVATQAWLTDSERGVLERLGEVAESGAAGGVIGGLVTMALLGARGSARLMAARPGEVVAPATEQPQEPVDAPLEAQSGAPVPETAPAATVPVAPVEPPAVPVPQGGDGVDAAGGATEAPTPALPLERRPTEEEIDAAIGPVRTREEVKADEAARREQEGDAMIREALGLAPDAELPAYAKARPTAAPAPQAAPAPAPVAATKPPPVEVRPTGGMEFESKVYGSGWRAQTGQPATFVGWRGQGRTAGQKYAEGVEGPALGPGLYIAPSENEASRYGDTVREERVEARNPLVISSDAALARSAGREAVPHDNQSRVVFLDRVRRRAEMAGHDAIVIALGAGDFDPQTKEGNKRLREIFDHDQVVSLRQPPTEGPKLVPRQLTLADPDTDPELAADTVEKAEMGDHAAMPASARTAPPPDPNGVFKPIAPRLKGAATTATAMPSPGRPISSPQVQDAFARVVEAAGNMVPFRIGRIGQRDARGVFKVGPEVIRIREAGNLPTAAHEMGHALEKALYGWKQNPWTSARVGAPAQRELQALGRELYGDTKPAGGYRREGWAEFTRLWLTDQATASEKAPKLTAWFETTFLPDNPEVATALRQAGDAMGQWQRQGPRARTQASIEDPTSPGARLRSIGETLRQAFGKQAWVEMGEPIRQFAEQAQQRLGDVLPSSQDPWALYEGLRLTHDARAERMVSESMIDLAGNRTGPSLKQALAPVRGKREEFTEYLWGRQAQLYWNDPQGRNPGLSREDAYALVEELRSPAFELAEGMLRQWHEGVLDYAAQASPAFAQVVERVRESHPGYLMPLQRAFDDLDDIWKRAARRSAGQATSRSPVQSMRGSGRRIKEPFQAMISNARAVVLKAHQRAVLDAVIGLSHVEGMGGLVEKVPQDQVPAASRTIAQVLEEVRRKLGPGASIDVQGGQGVDVDTLLGETLTFFAPAQQPKGRDPILPYWNGSSVDWYYVDGGLYRSLTGMDTYRLPAIVHWTLGATARSLRLGTTGMNPAFSLVTNTLRDLPALWMQSQSSANGGQLFASWLNQVGRSALGTAVGDKGHSKEMRAWLDMGGAMAQSLGQDIGHTRRAARQLFQGRVVRTIDPRNWMDALRDVFGFSEAGARAVEIGRVAKEIGWEPGTPLSLDQSIDLLRAGKRVTTDFSAAGELSRVFNQMVPFLGSSIQGSRAAVRAAKHHPARFMFRGMQMAAATLAAWWAIKDEDWYKELPARERFGYWHFKAGNEVIRIPRPFEVGAFFSALPEALADGWYRSDPARATQWFRHMLDVTAPPILPVPVEESLEQAANVDFYNQVPIVPRGELEIPAEEQFGEYTSRAAIALGDVFNVSPRRIEHGIRGVFGGVGTDVIEMLGLGPAKLAREDEPADTPILGRLFMRGGASPYRSESVDKLWGRLEEYTLRQGSRKAEETAEQRQMRLQLSDATKAVSALSWVRAHAKDNEARRRLSVEILKIARDALEAEEAAKVDRGRFADQRKKAEAREAAGRKAQ